MSWKSDTVVLELSIVKTWKENIQRLATDRVKVNGDHFKVNGGHLKWTVATLKWTVATFEVNDAHYFVDGNHCKVGDDHFKVNDATFGGNADHFKVNGDHFKVIGNHFKVNGDHFQANRNQCSVVTMIIPSPSTIAQPLELGFRSCSRCFHLQHCTHWFSFCTVRMPGKTNERRPGSGRGDHESVLQWGSATTEWQYTQRAERINKKTKNKMISTKAHGMWWCFCSQCCVPERAFQFICTHSHSLPFSLE